MSDPTTLLASLDPATLRERLDNLDSERAALIILLRAARARQRQKPAKRDSRTEIAARTEQVARRG